LERPVISTTQEEKSPEVEVKKVKKVSEKWPSNPLTLKFIENKIKIIPKAYY
jgi:hypothetical protein